MPGNIVTSYSFRGAGGAIGPRGAATVPGGGTPPSSYLVAPVIVLASDTVLATPLSTFKANTDATFLDIRRWYWDHLGGYTFDVLPVISLTIAETEAQRNGQYPTIEFNAAKVAVTAAGRVPFVQVLKVYSGIFGNAQFWPRDAFWGNTGDLIGFVADSAAVARVPGGELNDATLLTAPSPPTSGATFTVRLNQGLRFSADADITLPKTARIWGPTGSFDTSYEEVAITGVTGDTVTVTRHPTVRRTIAAGDLIGVGNPGDTIASRVAGVRGAMAHECGHGFGLDHPGVDPADPDPEAGRLMGNDFRIYPNCVFTGWEKAKMLEPARPPFLTFRLNRP